MHLENLLGPRQQIVRIVEEHLISSAPVSSSCPIGDALSRRVDANMSDVRVFAVEVIGEDGDLHKMRSYREAASSDRP